MSKELWAVLTAGALVASVFSALPANAAPEIPATANIEDPAGDANTLSGDVMTPAGTDGNVSNVGDIQKVWFTNDTTSLTLNILTTIAPPAGSVATAFDVYTSPGEGSVSAQKGGCLRFRLVVPAKNAGGTYQGKLMAKAIDRCNDGSSFYSNGAEGEVTIEELPDGTGLTQLKFPRSYSPLLADGQTLTAPQAQSNATVGSDQGPNGPIGTLNMRYDDTKIGTDYAIVSGGETPAGPPVATPVPADETPVKNGCKKGKGKKKGCKKESAAPKACDTYTPGERGKDAETTVVTPAATAEAPIELELNPGAGAGIFYSVQGHANPLVSHAYRNVQVDSDGDSVGLYVRIEFAKGEDQDLFVRNADDSVAAQAAGGNQAPSVLGDGTGTGGHSEETAEQIDGVLTPDCGGYTVEAANAFGEGHTVMKLWLGPATWDPTSQSAIPAKGYV